MFFINELKRIVNYETVIVFLIISYFLIFRTSKQHKRNNYLRDYKIVKATGIIYAILATASLFIIR